MVKFAQNGWPLAEPVEQGFDLIFNQGPLFFNDQKLFEPAGKIPGIFWLDREGLFDVEQADAELPHGKRIEAQLREGGHQIAMRFADGDDPQPRLIVGDHQIIDFIGAGKGAGRRQFPGQPFLNGDAGRIAVAEMQTAGRRRKIGGLHEPELVFMQGHGPAALNRLRDRFEAHPSAGKAR